MYFRGETIAADDNVLRILHITDSHLFAEKSAALRGTVTFESLRSVIEHYRSSDWRADIVYCTGDLIQDDTAEAYNHFCDLIRELDLPVYCIPGNHDIRSLMQRVLADHAVHYCEVVGNGTWTVLPLDSCVDDHAGGRLSTGALRHLDSQLSGSPAPHALIALHHPPLEMNSRWLDSVGLDNAEEFMNSIGRAGKVRGVIFGHVHQSVDARIGDVDIIGTPSTCAQFLPCSDEFAVDDRPPAYRRISLLGDGSIRSKLMWL